MKKETFGFMFALVVLFGAYFAIQSYYIKKQQAELKSAPNAQLTQQATPAAPPPPVAPVVAQTTQTAPAINSTQAPKERLPLIVASSQDLIISTNHAKFEFSPTGGCISNNSLLNERTSSQDPTPVSVIQNDNVCKAYGFRIGSNDLRGEPARISKISNKSVQIVQRTKDFEVTRVFQFDKKGYSGTLSIDVENISTSNQSSDVDFEIGATSDSKKTGGMFSMHPPQFHDIAIRLDDGTIKREATPFVESPERKELLNEYSVSPTWMIADSLYWMNALIPASRLPISFEAVRTGFNLKKDALAPIDQTVYEAWIKHPINLSPGQIAHIDYKFYIGPKNETILKNFSEYHLNETIDYGFFKIIARPLYYALYFMHGLMGNWGVSIILLTILINILFMPLQIKGYVAAQKMQQIQPQLKALQEKFKEDKQALQRETMGLMSKAGVNPLSGCLPLLPQIPVFFGLDSALRHTFDLRQSPFYFWISDLTQPDPYFVLPVIMAALMISYQRLIPMPSMDPTQAKMMKIMPIMFSVFMIFYPSGLALYVITNTTISMIRQSVLMRRYKKT